MSGENRSLVVVNHMSSSNGPLMIMSSSIGNHDTLAIPDPVHSGDINFFVSGAMYSKSSQGAGDEVKANRGAAFGGDLTVSGVLHGGPRSEGGYDFESLYIGSQCDFFGSAFYFHGSAGFENPSIGQAGMAPQVERHGAFVISGGIGSSLDETGNIAGEAVFGGDLAASGGIHLASTLYHMGNSTTKFEFGNTGDVEIFSNGFSGLKVIEDSSNDANAILLGTSGNRIVVMSSSIGSGHTETEPNPYGDPSAGDVMADVSFWVSGSKQMNASTMGYAGRAAGAAASGVAVFQGDLLVSGAFYGHMPTDMMAGGSTQTLGQSTGMANAVLPEGGFFLVRGNSSSPGTVVLPPIQDVGHGVEVVVFQWGAGEVRVQPTSGTGDVIVQGQNNSSITSMNVGGNGRSLRLISAMSFTGGGFASAWVPIGGMDTSTEAGRSTRIVTSHKYTNTSNSDINYIRFNTNGADSSPGVNNKWVAPADGILMSVSVRSTHTPGSTVVGLHVAADGTTDIPSSPNQTATINIGTADTTVMADFGAAAHSFDGGNIVGLSINPSSNHGNVDITCVWAIASNS